MMEFNGRYERHMEEREDSVLTFTVDGGFVNVGVRAENLNVILSQFELRVALSEVLDRESEYFEFRDGSEYELSQDDDDGLRLLVPNGGPTRVEYVYLREEDARTLLNVLSNVLS